VEVEVVEVDGWGGVVQGMLGSSTKCVGGGFCLVAMMAMWRIQCFACRQL
jgi:hypothetical protein